MKRKYVLMLEKNAEWHNYALCIVNCALKDYQAYASELCIHFS